MIMLENRIKLKRQVKALFEFFMMFCLILIPINCTSDDISGYLTQASVQKIQYQLVYDSNNGSGQLDTIATRNQDNITVQNNTYSKADHYFIGWNTKVDGTGTSHKAGSQLELGTSDLTLYAIWRKMIKVKKTGLNTCNSANEDGCTQLGESVSYTGPFALDSAYSGDLVTKDELTSLYWQACTAGADSGSASCNGIEVSDKLNQADAVSYCQQLNSANSGAGFAGLYNWRLPTVIELTHIIDYSAYVSESDPAINATHFPSTQDAYYWSSTSYANDSGKGWFVDFNLGNVDERDVNESNFVRCVSGSQFVAPDSLSYAEAFTDPVTGLTWNRCSQGLNWDGSTCNGSYDELDQWLDALSSCANSTAAGYSDWRLPSINELYSIINYASYNPTVNQSIFPDNSPYAYWSSSGMKKAYPIVAWGIIFLDGEIGSAHKTDSLALDTTNLAKFHVRCVRGP
jgi:hypothetical protein